MVAINFTHDNRDTIEMRVKKSFFARAGSSVNFYFIFYFLKKLSRSRIWVKKTETTATGRGRPAAAP